ncbi:sulfotransferase family 2 domain-containing protein [Nitratidesulfovibrio sp. 1201_IL3209]|uniref:sulfotransferase family 2 domain-containing protein n=1 Tax=Nitratidesulfovibrio sp. 1201_IL3209 TaxID=3084053 RepID=UPI002FD9466E
MIPAIFLHIQKTAGTTIVNLARKHYGNDNVLTHGDYLCGFSESPDPHTFFSKENIRARFKEKLFISGHFGFSFCSAFMGERYSFTFLRKPAERIVSFYYFCLTRSPEESPIYKIAQGCSLEEFLKMGFERSDVRLRIWNNQMWQLAHGYCSCEGRGQETFSPKDIEELAYKNIRKFSFVGTVDNFRHDRDRILSDLGMQLLKVDVRDNVTPGRPAIKDLPLSTRQLLEKLTALEQPLYDEIASKRNTTIKKYFAKFSSFVR